MTDAVPDLDYFQLVRRSKRTDLPACRQTVRLALLGDAATQQLVPLLMPLFRDSGIQAEVFEGDFDAIELAVYDDGSDLYRFQPDVIVILNSVQALRARYYQRTGSGRQFLEERIQTIDDVWGAIRARSSALIVQSNFVLPYERQFGNFDHKIPDSFYSIVAALNARISEHARAETSVLINDVEAIASHVGRRHWFDERFWNLAKAFCALEHLPRVAQNIVDIVVSSQGRVVKCVALDLDNTLWGGVIGDDGMDGIKISAHGEGEAFHLFQSFLLELKRRGVLLAVCSKNDHQNALQPFREHPDMVLKEDDITVFVANWENKADNLRAIQATLEIGFDSIVFLDDNPFERNLVREFLPDVIVPELPEDPSEYVRAISELNLFEVSSFSTEDLQRAQLYRKEAERRVYQKEFSNIGDYLNSLDMRITVARFDPFHLPRITQLIQRSNQFNLTTHRYSQAECELMMQDEARCVPLYAKLCDRFGDHGLVSVVVLQQQAEELVISDWLMSCRVLARGVEQYLMSCVVELASHRGLPRIIGEYIPTAKNGMVREFYAQFGFQKVAEDADGRSQWVLSVDTYEPHQVFIHAAEP